MTNEELRQNWTEYAVELKTAMNPELVEQRPLKDMFVLCANYPAHGALFFDTGGVQGAPGYIMKVEGDNLISINPVDPDETSVLGKLVRI